MASCSLPYIESKFRQSDPEVADKLNNQHIKIVQDAVDSNLFRFKNRQLLFSQEGTKKLDRQRDYVNNINQQYGVNVLKNVDGVLSVNVLGLAPPIFTKSKQESLPPNVYSRARATVLKGIRSGAIPDADNLITGDSNTVDTDFNQKDWGRIKLHLTLNLIDNIIADLSSQKQKNVDAFNKAKAELDVNPNTKRYKVFGDGTIVGPGDIIISNDTAIIDAQIDFFTNLKNVPQVKEDAESGSLLYQSILNTGVSPEEATRLYNQTKTPEFKEWFGKSVVKDVTGEPLLVYHGTKSKEDFDTFKAGSSTGMFFTDDKQYAADVRGGRVVGPFFLRIEKPVEVEEEIDNDVAFENKDKGDGIIGVDYGQGLSSDGKTFVVYNPNQIKSLNNTGQFSESPNIYLEQGEQAEGRELPNEKELENKLIEFLNSKGIAAEKIKAFQKRMGERGTPVTIYGMADMLNKLVRFSDVTSLVEETAHMMVEMFVDTNSSILEQVVDTEQYKKVKEDYKDVYATESEFRKEALGKIVKKAMIDRNTEGIASRLLSRIKYFWNKMVDFFKGVKGLDTYLEEIMEMNPSKFDSSRLGEGVYYEIQLTPEQKILNDAVEAKKRRLEGMKRRMTEAKVEKNLEDQINSLKLDILKDQVELGVEKLIGFIKEDLKVVEKYVFNNKTFSGNVLGHLKDFIYYYKPLLEDIQRIDGHKDIDSLIGRFRKVESVYIDSRKGAVKNELGIDVGSEIDTDINRAEYYFGSLRDVGSDIARRIHALITEMKNLVFQKMYEPSIDLIREVGNVDVKRLREKVNGKYTHFFVTQYKLGEWYESEKSFKDALRKEFGLEDDQYEPLEKKDRIKYYRKLHQWKSKNQERRMLPEYYEMFLNLSYDTQVARDKYSADIKNLLLEVTSANGEVRFEDITEEQWETLNRLNRERRMLGNLYYEDGTKKEGTDLEIALEIKELNSKLKDHQTKDTSKYNATWRTKKKELSPEKFKLWEERTTETVYADEFFELLDAVGRDDYSEEYIQLRDEKNELIKPYRKADLSAEPVDIPDSVRDKIKELDRRMDALRSLMPKREKLDVKFSDVADVVKIPEYSKEYSAAQKRGKDAFKEWYDANHYTDVRGTVHPISIWTQVVPKDKKFIKKVPKSYWMEVSKDSVFYNPNFDESWHGPQPTKQWHNPQYDSLTAAEKKGLDALLKMNMEAHDLYKSSPRRYYQLPQTTMSLFDAVTEEGRLANIKQVLLRSITDNSDDTEQGEVDEKGRMMQHIRPDGSQAYFVPKPFVRLVDDPNLISSDLVSSVIAIRTQAEKHRESLKINASTELLLDTLKDSRHVGKSGKVTLGSETNLYKAIRGFLEEHVFGIKTPPIGHVNVLGHNVNISKVLGKIEKYVRDKNLVGNLFVAATAATSGVVFSKIEDMVGTYTSNKSKMFANKEYTLNSPAMMLEAGKKIKTNKVGLIISRFIGEQDMFDDLDKNRMARLGTETPYAPFTMVGHNISGRVVIAMLHNTRWDGNKFVTSQNYKGKNFESLPSMYSMFEGKDNKAVVKKEYQDILTLKEIAKMTGKIRFVTDRIDSKISDTDKAAAHRDALLKLATTHRGWLFRNTQDRFKSKGFNYITEEFEEGHYRTWWRFLTKTIMRPNRLRILKNLLAEWETLEPYEKRNVIRSLWELGAAVSVGILARALQNLADDDDEDYLLNMASYVMNRTLLEVSVYPSLLTPLTFPIGISEVGSLLSSPVAAVSVVNTLTDVVYLFDSEEIESGRFEGMTHREKFLIKMTPGLSGYYTTTDPTSANQFLKGKALRPLNFIYKDE